MNENKKRKKYDILFVITVFFISKKKDYFKNIFCVHHWPIAKKRHRKDIWTIRDQRTNHADATFYNAN